MAKFLVIGVQGEAGLWLVDCGAGTVEQIEAGSLGGTGAADGDLISNTSEARSRGFTVVRGIDLAVATDSRSEAVAQARFTGGGSGG